MDTLTTHEGAKIPVYDWKGERLCLARDIKQATGANNFIYDKLSGLKLKGFVMRAFLADVGLAETTSKHVSHLIVTSEAKAKAYLSELAEEARKAYAEALERRREEIDNSVAYVLDGLEPEATAPQLDRIEAKLDALLKALDIEVKK